MNSLIVILGTSAAAALFIVLALGVKLRPEKKVIRSPISKGRHSKRRLRRASADRAAGLADPVPTPSETGKGGPPLEMGGTPPNPLESPTGARQPAGVPGPKEGESTLAPSSPDVPIESSIGDSSAETLTPTGWSSAGTASSSQNASAAEAAATSSQTVAPLEKTGTSTTARLPDTEEVPAQPEAGPNATAAEPGADTRSAEPGAGSKPWPSALRPFSSPPAPPIPPPVAPVEPPATEPEGNSAKEAVVATPEPETSILETAKPETGMPAETAAPKESPATPEGPIAETATPKEAMAEAAISETPKPDAAKPPVSPPFTPRAAKPTAPTPSYYDLDFKPPGSEEPAEAPATASDLVEPKVNATSAPPVDQKTPAVSPPAPDLGETTTKEPSRQAIDKPTAVASAYEAAVTIAAAPRERPSSDLLGSDSVETAGRLKWGGWKIRTSEGMAVAATKLLLALMLFSVVLSLIAIFAIKTLGAVMRGLVGT